MKLTFFSIVLPLCAALAYGQKPLITLDTYKTWTGAYRGDISNNGRYAMYTIVNEPVGSGTLVITETSGKELYRRSGVQDAKFTSNSRFLIAKFPNDSLLIYDLKNKKQRFKTGVKSYKLGRWYKVESLFLTVREGNIKIEDFNGKIVFEKGPILQYVAAANGAGLVTIENDLKKEKQSVSWIDALSGKSKQICEAHAASNVIMNNDCNRVAFIDNDSTGNKIMYCDLAEGKQSKLLYRNDSLDVAAGGNWRFSDDSRRIFFSVKERRPAKNQPANAGLEIWSYQDKYLQSYYNGKNAFGENISQNWHVSSIAIDSKETIQLTNGNELVVALTLKPGTDKFCIVETPGKSRSERWPDGMGRSYFLCDVVTGKRTLLEEDQVYPVTFWNISPTMKFVAYYKTIDTTYYCYEISKHKRVNVTPNLSRQLVRYDKQHYPRSNFFAANMLGWLPSDKRLLVRGTYDVWSVDATGVDVPVNITKGIGASQRLVFSLAGQNKMETIRDPENLLLTAFDLKTKNYGFFSVDTRGKSDPKILSMRKWYLVDAYNFLPLSVFRPTSEGYLLYAENLETSGNYYYSKDLKTFSSISTVSPGKLYNWLTADLQSYKDSAGNELQGILYKPDNFDPTKKYPVIFNVYEFQSNRLNTDMRPELRGAEFIVSLMVSNGYLVFEPDLKSSPRIGGDALLQCIHAGIDHISKFNYVDTARMGISGHSVGGFVTNYTVTHLNKFKAAIAGAGISDMIRAASDLYDDGAVKQEMIKDAVYMMQTDLLSDVPTYLRNSPILSAKNMNTPLMLVHNDHDGNVRYEQSRSFFIVLRNLNKPCWWLNYKGQDHAVTGEQYQIDYNTRVKEFYDHYLKGAPMPNWMKDHL